MGNFYYIGIKIICQAISKKNYIKILYVNELIKFNESRKQKLLFNKSKEE